MLIPIGGGQQPYPENVVGPNRGSSACGTTALEQKLVGRPTYLFFVVLEHLDQFESRRNLVGNSNFLAIDTNRFFEPNFLPHLVDGTDNKFVGS